MGHPQTEETKRKISVANKGKVRSEEFRLSVSKAHKGKIAWNKGIPCSEETKQKISASRKGQQLTEEQYNNMINALPRGEDHQYYGKHRDKETRKKISDSLKGRFVGDKNPATRPEVRKKMSEKASGINNPFYGKHHSPETIKKIREANRGEKSYLWKGGISFEPYCPKFTQAFREYIRDKFNRSCIICGKQENDNINSKNIIHKLSIHHVDYDKVDICNGKTWPFVPLCASCHGKTNHNRWYWFNLLINYWLLDSEKHLNTIFIVGDI